MIEASKVIGHSAAKWSEHQPHEGILWTNKLSRGVKGCDKSYIAFSQKQNTYICVSQLWDVEKERVCWLVGSTRKSFPELNEAREYARSLLND